MTKVAPSKLAFVIVAENIRQELGGKVTIIGAFLGGRIVLPKDAVFPATMALGFYALFDDGDGEFNTKVRLFNPDSDQMGPDIDLGKSTKFPNQSLGIIVNFPIFQVVKAGRYSIEIYLDDHVYKDGFAVSQ
jgi:hypothetical protein